MNKNIFACLIVVAACSASYAEEPADPTVWIGKMLDSMATTDYSGTFVYSHNATLDVVDIQTGVDAEGRFHLLSVSNGEPRKFEFQNGVLSWFRENFWQKVGTPEGVAIKPSQLLALWKERLNKYYRFELGESSRVAKRPCQAVAVVPLDRLRYGYDLCIDNETNVLLSSKLLGLEGRAIEQIMFTDIVFQAEHNKVSRDNTAASAENVVEQRTALNVPVMKRLPAGFKLMSREMKLISGGRASIEHWRISDGLANISVYVEPAKQERIALAGGSSVGAISVYGMIENGYQVTVIGDVPTPTLQVIADALGS